MSNKVSGHCQNAAFGTIYPIPLAVVTTVSGEKYIPRYYIYQYLCIFVLPETSACDINKAKYFYLNSQINTIFSGSIQPDQEKAYNICPFQRFQYFPKA